MHLLDPFIPIFLYVCDLLHGLQGDHPSCLEVKKRLAQLLSTSESGVRGGAFTQEEYDLARFAVCAWVDEMLANSAWNDRDLWLREPLQRANYNTTAAGVGFFERLHELRADQGAVREVYYVCLCLGFAGRYCQEEDRQTLERLKMENLKLLVGDSPEPGQLFPELFSSAASPALSRERPLRPAPVIVAAIAAAPLLFMVLYVIYRCALRTAGEHLLQTVTR